MTNRLKRIGERISKERDIGTDMACIFKALKIAF